MPICIWWGVAFSVEVAGCMVFCRLCKKSWAVSPCLMVAGFPEVTPRARFPLFFFISFFFLHLHLH